MKKITSIWLLLCALACAPIGTTSGAQPTSPSMSSNQPTTSQTYQTTVNLSGSVAVATDISAVRWVNQFGQRGSGSWYQSAQEFGTWAVSDIPLHVGINRITVTVTDIRNRSISEQYAINRVYAPGSSAPASLPVGSGVLNNRPIAYQLWNGNAVVEGDLIVDLSAGFTAPGRESSVPRALTEGGAHIAGLGISYASGLWPLSGGIYVVPYTITGTEPTNLTNAITAFNAQFAGLIQFQQVNGQANYVNITVDGSGGSEGYSNVGMVGGEQTLDCGSGCTEATWMHEMGHTVGLLHEHQRPDRGNYITLNLANADLPNVPGNFTLFQYDYQTIGLYDYASVMHYAAFDFSKAGLPVIESIPAGIPLSNETGYSAGDVDQIERLYGAAPKSVTVTTNPAGLQIIVDGATYTSPHTFSFPLGSMHTLNVPGDPQNVNPADGSAYAFGNWNDRGARSHTINIVGGTGTLTSPAKSPAITMYEANFIRLQPFTNQQTYPSGSGTVNVTPAAVSEYGGTYFTDRTLITLSVTPQFGYSFYSWSDVPYPPSGNPYSYYIQSPSTSVLAIMEPSTYPVTIVGESITGPNGWNPGLSGTVDGNFTLLPTGFTADPSYDGSAWNAGTSHAISVDQTQSPVTTNVYYNYNSWSDGGAISHNITQATGGSQTIAASFTPFYASYTVPPPLGSSSSSCAGGVATSPAGTSYADNIFSFYEDGASVTTTATANSTYPNIVFAGWASGLSGSSNPQTTTIHDQFVPAANFNLSSTPLAISSLSPASQLSGSAALDVTIYGTGFTPNSTYAYWNGSYRSITYVSPTQMVMHLTAGDLAQAGGQDVYVGNYTTNASNQTCGVSAETSFNVLLTEPAAPTSNILWRNSSGQVSLWLMNGGKVSSYDNLGTPGASWTIAGTGDFNGDGIQDILWRNSNGEVAIWLLNAAGQLISSVNLSVVASSWTIIGTGDFNGDGTTDILWQNSNGQVAVWLMNSGRELNSINLNVVPAGWTYEGTGDFNGDGTTDVLWQNASGQLSIWLMKDGKVSSFDTISGAAFPWTIVGTGDFNGDGTADILWRNPSTSQVAVWLMKSGKVSSYDNLANAASTWTVKGIGDFNGDGTADILWQNSNGQVSIWLMKSGTGQVSSFDTLSIVSSSWAVQP